MGLLRSLLNWVRGTIGPSARTAPADPEGDFRCGICGTAVTGPDATCPLCGSSDAVAADEVPARADGLSGAGAAEHSVADDTGTAAARLADGDLLARHAGRWERVDGGYRVRLPDGDRKVATTEEVRVLLYRLDTGQGDG